MKFETENSPGTEAWDKSSPHERWAFMLKLVDFNLGFAIDELLKDDGVVESEQVCETRKLRKLINGLLEEYSESEAWHPSLRANQ